MRFEQILALLTLTAALVLSTSCDITIDDGSTEIRYTVSGSACAADVTYAGRRETTRQETDVPMGWDHEFDAGDDDLLFVSGQNQCDSGTITVRIYKNGKLYRTATSAGAYATASASGSS